MGRPGWGTCDLGAELHGAQRSGWRELHDPEAVVEGKVGVEPPSEGCVERLGAVGISHGEDDRLKLQVDSCAVFRPAGFAILSVDGAHPGLLWSARISLSHQIGCLAPGSAPVLGVRRHPSLRAFEEQCPGPWLALLVQLANDERLRDVGTRTAATCNPA